MCQTVFREVEQINGKHVIITLGDQGLLYKDQEKIKHLPAYGVKAVDTTGAGDIFHGAFAYGLYRKLALLENRKQSSMAAAVSVQSLGGQASIPRMGQVRRELAAAEEK